MQEREIFIVALQRSASKRSDWLAVSCGEDDELRRRIEKLLAAHEEGGKFLLDTPPPGLEQHTTHAAPLAEIGEVVGRYKLLEHIGEGGYGDVFLAQQQDAIRREVAVKVIKPGMDTRMVIARFEAERQAMALMNHPSIAKILDAGATDSGRPYFVMEVVNGLPITEYCDSGQLTIPARLGLFVDVCRAVQHAHHKGIIHRDIKPSNVLVSQSDGHPTPKVIDFGVAKAIGQCLIDKTSLTQHGQLIGTPDYMSPEQANVDGEDVDTRSDVYSLGVLLYELVVGATPFATDTLSNRRYDEICQVITDTDPPTPSRRLSSLGEDAQQICRDRQCPSIVLKRVLKGDLSWIIMKALEKDRSRRYATVDALSADIHRYLSDEPVAARAPSTLYQLKKLTYRHRHVVFVGSAFILLLLVATIVSSTMHLKSETQRRQAEDNLETSRRLIMRTLVPAVETLRWRPGTQELSRQLNDDAIVEFTRLSERSMSVEDQLDLARLHLIRAYTDFSQGHDMLQDCDTAISVLERLAVSHPDDATIRSKLSRAYHLLGHHYCQRLLYKKAAEAYAKSNALPHAPEWFEGGWYAFALRKTGRLEEADVQSDQAMRLSPSSRNSLQLREHRAWILLELGQSQAARQVVADARLIVDDPLNNQSWNRGFHHDFWDANMRLMEAVICNLTQDYEEGERHARKAILTFERLREERPEVIWMSRFSGRASIALSDALITRGRWEDSQQALLAAIGSLRENRQPRDLDYEVSAQFRLGQLLAANGRSPDAKRALADALEGGEKLLGISAEEPLCRRDLLSVLTLSPIPDFRDADRALSIARGIDAGSDPMLWLLTGLAEYRAGRWADAIKSAETGISLRSDADLLGQFLIAMAEWRQGHVENARIRFEQAAVALDTGEPILFTRHWGPLTIRQLRMEAEHLIVPSP